MNIKTLKELFFHCTEKYKDNKFACSTNGKYYTYGDYGKKGTEISALLAKNNIKFGDKVAILSQGTPEWGIAFFSCVAYGRVAVPMLPDFSESEITNIIEHSESKAIFVSKKLYYKLNQEIINSLDVIIQVDDFSVIKGEALLESNISQAIEELEQMHTTPDEFDLALIIYTSGTTGNSKGVMLSNKNLISHLYIARDLRPSFEWDIWLSILPLSHALECSLSFLLPFSSGSSVYYIDKAPTPSVLLKTLKEVRPTTMLVVPLIIEKIYKNSILPKIKAKPIMAKLYKTNIGRKLIHRLVGRQMKDMFGGRMRFFGIGGAKLDGTVETFLYEAKFPYAIGYGLTECSPLLAGAIPDMVKWQTTGPAVKGVRLRILNPDPITGEGELLAKGDNIMAGYYKNPTATAEVFTEDGWFRTKDLGHIDSNGWVSIRGRMNNMIIGASGENIYPEEIETVINSHTLVAESLVMADKGLLKARVVLNASEVEALNDKKNECFKTFHSKRVQLIDAYEAKKREWVKEYESKRAELGKEICHKRAEWRREYNIKRIELYRAYVTKRDEAMNTYHEKLDEIASNFNLAVNEMEKEIHTYVNSKVNKFSRVATVTVQHEAFEKTATHKIKRYLYKN